MGEILIFRTEKPKALDEPVPCHLRHLVDIKPIHLHMAEDVVRDAIARGFVPGRLLILVGVKFSNGHPSWEYVKKRLAYELAVDNPKATALVTLCS